MRPWNKLILFGVAGMAVLILTAPDPTLTAAQAIKMLVMIGAPALLLTWIITRA